MSASSETHERPVKSVSGLNIFPVPSLNCWFAWQQHAEQRNGNNRSTNWLIGRPNPYVLEDEALRPSEVFSPNCPPARQPVVSSGAGLRPGLVLNWGRLFLGSYPSSRRPRRPLRQDLIV